MFFAEPLYWLKNKSQQNFGDFLSEYLKCYLFMPVSMRCDSLRIIGSCISSDNINSNFKKKNEETIFWGCGLRDELGITDAERAASNFLAVRGPLTKKILGLGDNVPIGDPGLLLPALYQPQVRKELLGVSVLVPHFLDQRDDMRLKELSGCEFILRPNLKNDLNEINKFVDCIISAEFVLCGSLHAAIVAAAYGKPFGFWDSGSIDLPFKWRDFSLSVSIPCEFHQTLVDAKYFYVKSIEEQIKIPILWPLLVSAPMAVRPEVLAKTIEFDIRRHVDGVFQVGQPQVTSSLIADVLRSEVDYVEIQTANLKRQIENLTGEIQRLTEETIHRGEWALALDTELKEERAKVVALTKSFSWRLTLPLREAERWITSPKFQTKRYVKGAICFTKRIYQMLPLSLETKAKHRGWISSTAPSLLLATGPHLSSVPMLAIDRVLGERPTASLEPQTIDNLAIDTAPDKPLVSVIIPVYGNLDYTLRCLASIASHPPHAAFEVIVVDDCSPDKSWEVLSQKVKGLRLLRNNNNEGFIRSCNNGAKAAQGHYLYFLNNDTEVTEGWLDALLSTFSDFPGTGLAGSKLVYPDGSLQEAGGIIWNDGSASNFGRFQDPRLPLFNYAREVDYCSGASIMVSKTLFEELGGFDPFYSPAYCEDSDLALKIRDKGLRVIYQPLSMIFHHEGVTSGTDTSQGVKTYQVENTRKLFERWQERLQFHQARGNDVDNAKDRKATRRVLVIDHCTPTPDADAGSVTLFNLLLLLREMDFQVTFIPESNFLYMPEYTTALQRNGIEVLYAPFCTSVKEHLKEQGARYDLALLVRPTVVENYVKMVRKYCAKAKILFETADLHHLRMGREALLLNDLKKKKAADQMKVLELRAMQEVDATIIRSSAELELLQSVITNEKLHLFPLIMDAKGTNKTFSERKDIIFVGGYQHSPNVDAAKYFVEQIMPLLREQLPGVRFHIVGSNPPDEITALASDDVVVTGFVKELNPLLDQMRVSVAPLRYGAGIKGKVGTAMAAGLPVVATSLAGEGMQLKDRENIIIADGADVMAQAIVEVYQDAALWNQLSSNGVAFAQREWGAEAAWNILAEILADIGIQVHKSAHSFSLYSDIAHSKYSKPHE